MKFSEILRALAEQRNLTQKQIAAELGIPASTIGGYFQGTSEPDLEMIKRIAEYFQCSLDLLAGHNSAPSGSHREEMLLHLFRSMDAQQQTLWTEIGKTIVQCKNQKS